MQYLQSTILVRLKFNTRYRSISDVEVKYGQNKDLHVMFDINYYKNKAYLSVNIYYV